MHRPDVDPLSEVLGLLRPEAFLAAELHARGRWGLSFVNDPGVKFGVVIEGSCVFASRGKPARRLRAGDVFLFGAVPAYVIASDLDAPTRDGSALLRNARGQVAQLGRGPSASAVRIIGGYFALDRPNAHLLLDALPDLAVIPSDDATPMTSIIHVLVDEVRSARPGRLRALDQLAQLVLTFGLRWLDAKGARKGWLRALADPRIRDALHHVHANVARGASVAELARIAGMSRAAFAARFKELVGKPPLAYAIQWRMSLAKDALATTDRAIGAMAFELGYASERAFSMAFRREVGCSPRGYRANASDRPTAIVPGRRRGPA
jgi:AraC-like DNA-binding protein